MDFYVSVCEIKRVKLRIKCNPDKMEVNGAQTISLVLYILDIRCHYAFLNSYDDLKQIKF